MSEDMTRDELLYELKTMHQNFGIPWEPYARDKRKLPITQAYTQLQAIVEQHFTLSEFAKKISQQEDMPPKYQKLVSEHFWELMGEADTPQAEDTGEKE